MKKSALAARGFEILPASALPSRALARAVLAAMPRDGAPGVDEWRPFARKTGWDAASAPGGAEIKRFTRALTGALRPRGFRDGPLLARRTTGVPSTIHSAPLGRLRRRVVLIVFYTRAGVNAGLPLRARLKEEQRFFQRRYGAPDPEVKGPAGP